MVAYTITTSDVASVDSASGMVAGIKVDWNNETITYPASVDGVTGQTLIDTIRFVEATSTGLAQPKIIDGSGKVQIGTDPLTGEPVFTGVVGVLNASTIDWKIVTAKTSGTFAVIDIYRSDFALPYNFVSGVNIIYRQTVGNTVQQVTSGSGLSSAQATQLSELSATLASSGVFSTLALVNAPSGSGATPQEVWEYGTRELTAVPTGAALEATLTEIKGSGFNTAFDSLRQLSTTLDGRASQSTVDGIEADIGTLLSRTADISDLFGFTAGQPMVSDTSDGTITANGKTVTVTESGTQRTYTRS